MKKIIIKQLDVNKNTITDIVSSIVAGKYIANGKYNTVAEFDFNFDLYTKQNNCYIYADNIIENQYICEYLFEIFNDNHLSDNALFNFYEYDKLNIRSLSVGDIVIINNDSYICKSIGFERISNLEEAI